MLRVASKPRCTKPRSRSAREAATIFSGEPMSRSESTSKAREQGQALSGAKSVLLSCATG